LKDGGHLGNHIVQIAGSQDDEYIERAALDEVENLVLADELLLDARTQTVVDELGGDTLDGLFAGGIDFGEDDLVELTQGIGEIDIEVASARVEMGLKDGRDMPVLVQLANAACTLINLLGMMGIVTEEHQLVGLDLEIEAALHTAIGLHALP